MLEELEEQFRQEPESDEGSVGLLASASAELVVGGVNDGRASDRLSLASDQ